MPPRRPLLLLQAAALLVASAAHGQDKPKRRVLPPPRPAAAEAATSLAPAETAPARALPGGQSGTTRPVGLVGLTPVGDPAPACRAQCSKDRYVCHAADDPTDCDSRWVPCLQACSAR